jgi:hypothetical protein
VSEQRVVLEHEAHTPLAHRQEGGVLAAEQDAAVIGELQARDHAQQRGLAGAGRAQQRDQLAGGDVEIDIHQGREAVEGFVNTAYLYVHVLTLARWG